MVTMDRGVSMLGKLYREQIQAVKRGENPIGVAFEAGKENIDLKSGLFFATD